MKGFDQRFIDEIKAKNDIVDVCGKYVRLEQRGNDFWGRCPFHHEKTASFVVHGIEQFYHCFGCHKSGNVITLVMELESLDFMDAVKFLAERAKIPMPDVRYDDDKIKEQKRHKERVLALMKDTATFYVKNLRKEGSEKHVEYILKRGLTSETVTRFGMGASLDFNGLVDHLKGKGYTEKEMVDSGAVGLNKNGKPYDFLAGRLIIPGIDQFGNVISFCGRIIDNRKDVGKYVNTRETFIFSKGKNLFNINNLKKLKNEEGLSSIIIVEGHMDVISLVQAGIRNVVASMGTALTKDQARTLKRYADKVYICYDGDSAGQKATVRGLDILTEEGLDVKVVSMPEGLDPDEVISKYGVEGYKKCLLEAKPLIDFKIEVLKNSYDITTVDGKRKFASSAIKVIKESPSATEQEDLLKTVQSLTKFTFEALKRELYSTEEVKKPLQFAQTEITETDVSKEIMASRFILSEYLFDRPYAKIFDINKIEFDLPIHSVIKDFINSKKEKGEKIIFNELYDRLEDEDKQELSKMAELVTDENKHFDRRQYFEDCVKILLTHSLNKKMERLIKLFKEETDVEKRKALTKEMNLTLAEKSKISK